MVRYRTLLGPVAVAASLVVAMAGAALDGGAGTPASASGVGTAAATAGCGKAPGLASGTHTIQSNGKNRSFILRVPDNYQNDRPYRLVFGFHWVGATATDVATGQTVDRNTWAYYGLQRLANNSAIFVAPQGINNGWGNSGGEDVTFVDNMISRIDNALCVDTTQRFALGFSYGGAMTYAVACARPTVFRAVAVYGAGAISGCSGGTQPIAYFGAHGIRDNVFPISTGRSLRDRFVQNNGCAAQNAPEPTQGSLRHVTTTYSGCRSGYPVVWAAFDEGHIAAPQDGAPGDSGTRTWLPAETWNFFTQFGGAPPTTTPPPVTTTPPPPTTTAPPPPTTTPPPGAGACTATYRTTNTWSGGYQGDVTVTAGGSAINGWTVRWTLANGQTVSQLWNGSHTVSGSTVTVRNVEYNGSLPAGGNTTFGFLGTGTPSAPTLTCTSP
ncbi:cellulose binding domain-containing protein [Micromonospora sp. WMMD882]|uniref:cellulose binding domain-containing protein n=1 Tax=Micromonospora sp. WMMD882 TaxID=3015151 RepID=UPI00248A9552|nr:cellulose binding domain-containing protein [Micromonospora sp. WMMD882]WBB80951.1 cellulose binding domain-containing protein [Micromonospora sp. WMMD882]